MLCCFLSMIGSLFFTVKASPAAEGLTVAVAANFAPAMAEISAKYTEKTATPVQVTVSSTGKLYAQIRNGAPYDLFFSADSKRPESLVAEKKCDAAVPYVQGSVVLWSRDKALCGKAGDWQKAVMMSDLKKIGVANPKLAPYGRSAFQVLGDIGLLPSVQGKMVYGANVGQAFQYAATGATDVAFIAKSLARTPEGDKGCMFDIEQAKPVIQSGCVVSASKKRASAEEFLDFIVSDEMKSMLEHYGYDKP